MGEKLNLVLIIVLFLLIVGLSYYFYSNSTIEKKAEKIIIENYKVIDFSGMMRLVAECPEKASIIAGGCEAEASWINVLAVSQ